MKPYNIGVSVVFPPDTDTPGFENENKRKVSVFLFACTHLDLNGLLSLLLCVFYGLLATTVVYTSEKLGILFTRESEK